MGGAAYFDSQYHLRLSRNYFKNNFALRFGGALLTKC